MGYDQVKSDPPRPSAICIVPAANMLVPAMQRPSIEPLKGASRWREVPLTRLPLKGGGRLFGPLKVSNVESVPFTVNGPRPPWVIEKVPI